MSTTTTTTRTAAAARTAPAHPSLSFVLADYALHQSDPSEAVPPPAPAPAPAADVVTGAAAATTAAAVQNPPDWPTDHRRVPSYRPINYEFDLAARAVYPSRGIELFVNTMFLGIRMVTVAHRTWKMTGEKINDKWFRYDLGGEY